MKDRKKKPKGFKAFDALMRKLVKPSPAQRTPVKPWPPLDVLCSCGAVGRIEWDATTDRYTSPTPGWKWHPERLWNCGKRGHGQTSLR